MALQVITQSADTVAADRAAFILGRRLPADRLPAALGVLPAAHQSAFMRGAAGRATDLQRGPFADSLASSLNAPHIDPALAAWVFRARAPAPGLSAEAVRRSVGSARFDDQLAGARLLASPSAELPYELIEFMAPIPLATATRAVATRGTVPPAWWRRWIETVAIRVRANPRAWGNTWLALAEAAPRTVPEVRAALSVALGTLRDVSTGDAGVDAAFRCSNAALADVLAGALSLVPNCAADTHRWRSLVARVRYAKEQIADVNRAALMRQTIADAAGDVRVLEALPEAAVTLPPAVARPILQELAASRDPGVLASLLETLALHVQHARALPASLREQLIRAPFGLEEAPSLEARLQAIQLARTLGIAPPVVSSSVRAVQQALQPDAQVLPDTTQAAVPVRTGRLVLITHAGRITIALDGSNAPRAADLVVQAAIAGRYNGTTFHRVVPAFVAQGGDPRGDGYGGANAIVPTELSGARFERGTVGIALAGLDTGGMQFFIVTADAPHLDARYPWIGRVIEGMEVADELMAGDVMERVEFTPQ